jgi:hypothetical protein
LAESSPVYLGYQSFVEFSGFVVGAGQVNDEPPRRMIDGGAVRLLVRLR